MTGVEIILVAYISYFLGSAITLMVVIWGLQTQRRRQEEARQAFFESHQPR